MSWAEFAASPWVAAAALIGAIVAILAGVFGGLTRTERSQQPRHTAPMRTANSTLIERQTRSLQRRKPPTP